MNTEERTITIVDDIMGSGKSTWAINYINDNPDRKFLCIVPLLSECERFKDGTDIDIVDPEKWGSKWKHFRWLVENEKNIVTTHSLIQKMDLDMLELLKSKDYVLMIDECLDVLDTYKITKKALAYLVNFFMSPEIRQFVNHYDLIFDEDMCSLSALLQWMWRSQIRNGKPIDIYIPSERMRELLNNWIQNCYVTEKAA